MSGGCGGMGGGQRRGCRWPPRRSGGAGQGAPRAATRRSVISVNGGIRQTCLIQCVRWWARARSGLLRYWAGGCGVPVLGWNSKGTAWPDQVVPD